MRKIVWHSNAPWAPSGYGQQTALFVPRLAELGYDIAISAFYGLEGGMAEWKGLPVYPTDHTRLGKFRLPQYVQHFARGSDVSDVLVMTLMDVWTWIDNRHGGSAFFDDLTLASWVPIDHAPAPGPVLEALHEAKSIPVAMSRFGQDAIDAGGSVAGVDFGSLYVPHGVDTKLMQPRDRTLMRKGMSIPDDAFVIGMVANNQGSAPPRKAFPQVFQAFARLLESHDDAFLYLHTDPMGFADGVNLFALAKACGIPGDRFGLVDQLSYHLGLIEPETMSYIYSAMDVLACPSYGEGFGIPIIEAQACGTPVIVTDWTAMTELCGAGWKVQGDRLYDPGLGAFYMAPAVIEIADAFESAYNARGDQQLRDQAAAFAAGYDADLIVERYWKPTLQAIEERTQAARPNRAQRRAAARGGAGA
jgi:glycosyltransferase involved in cell wall biosynthesis